MTSCVDMVLYSCSKEQDKTKGFDIMFSKDLFIVCVSHHDLRDVKIDRYYDGDIYNLDTLIEGYKKQLKGLKIQISKFKDEAFIDVINEDKMLETTYSIVKKSGFVTKPKAYKD